MRFMRIHDNGRFVKYISTDHVGGLPADTGREVSASISEGTTAVFSISARAQAILFFALLW